ncbi:unnamed protein product [Pocillopora meandrina]|uniref:Integrase catalytic domain-containing protein n=1 Tax=Pocillopora meandrina TaxID=46732 RepID=A0AAU9Y612_9CNID|nr:unnamed protein product [Pocillopora meandrina]
MKDKDIHHFSTTGDTKAGMVERFNRTLKSRMYRYFTSANTYKYLNVFQVLVRGYNESFHRIRLNEKSRMFKKGYLPG